MEKRILYNGELTTVEKLFLPTEIKERLYEGFRLGKNLRKLGQTLGLTERTVKLLFEYYLEQLKISRAPYIVDSLTVETVLGNKKGPYFKSENEILKDLDYNYSWEDLSLHEKQFYLSYNGNKKRCFVRKRDEATDSEGNWIQ